MSVRVKILYRRYIRSAFSRHALTLNVVSSGALMWLGDFIQQNIETRHAPETHIDKQRLQRMFIIGLIEGPLHHVYYTQLDRFLPGRDMRTVFNKIIMDQVIASPMFITTFFYGLGFLEGRTFSASTEELRINLWTVYLADWLVWPPSQFLNFYFVPPQYRVLYINGVTTLYNVFLSWIKHRDTVKTGPQKLGA